MKLLLCFSVIIYILTFCNICHPHPHPHYYSRSVCLRPKSDISTANLKHCMMLTLIMLYSLGKFVSLYRNSFQFASINMRLNLRTKIRSSSLNVCHLEMLTAFIFLNWDSEDLVSVLILLNANYSLFTMPSINGPKVRTLIHLLEKIFKATLLANLSFCLCKPAILEWLIYSFKFFGGISNINSTIWLPFLLLTLSNDIELNPGPVSSNSFSTGFLSFCNWNLNTLSKDDFYRISLLEAHNTEFNYDIISLCETSLDDSINVPENALPGYRFHACNHPSGDRIGGVGIFYKETLPLRIRDDLSFDEAIVPELMFGRKKNIFYSTL